MQWVTSLFLARAWSWMSFMVPPSPSHSVLMGGCYSNKSASQFVSNPNNVAPHYRCEEQFEIPGLPWKLQVPGPAVGWVHRGRGLCAQGWSQPCACSRVYPRCCCKSTAWGHLPQPRHLQTAQVWSWARASHRDLNLICAWKN